MLIVETIRKIRCAHQRDGRSIRQIARDFHMSRNTVKKVLRGQATECTYYSDTGTSWTPLGSTVTISLGSAIYDGLAMTAHNTPALCTATFINVTVK